MTTSLLRNDPVLAGSALVIFVRLAIGTLHRLAVLAGALVAQTPGLVVRKKRCGGMCHENTIKHVGSCPYLPMEWMDLHEQW